MHLLKINRAGFSAGKFGLHETQGLHAHFAEGSDREQCVCVISVSQDDDIRMTSHHIISMCHINDISPLHTTRVVTPFATYRIRCCQRLWSPWVMRLIGSRCASLKLLGFYRHRHAPLISAIYPHIQEHTARWQCGSVVWKKTCCHCFACHVQYWLKPWTDKEKLLDHL